MLSRGIGRAVLHVRPTLATVASSLLDTAAIVNSSLSNRKDIKIV